MVATSSTPHVPASLSQQRPEHQYQHQPRYRKYRSGSESSSAASEYSFSSGRASGTSGSGGSTTTTGSHDHELTFEAGFATRLEAPYWTSRRAEDWAACRPRCDGEEERPEQCIVHRPVEHRDEREKCVSDQRPTEGM